VIVDTSAVVAIILRESGFEVVEEKLATASSPAMGAPTLVETGLVLTTRLGENAGPLLARFIQETRISIVPFVEDHWRAAIDAHATFGKGRHRARLNFGDCLTYAIAKLARQPVLCVGGDFDKTDLTIA
jgi:ribonuclease VapC